MSEPQPIRTAEVDTGVDLRSDLSPTSPTDRKRMEELMARRADASELKNKNILKGMFTVWWGSLFRFRGAVCEAVACR